MIWCHTLWFGAIHYDLVPYIMIWCHTLWFGVIHYDTLWFGVIHYDLVSYIMIWCHTLFYFIYSFCSKVEILVFLSSGCVLNITYSYYITRIQSDKAQNLSLRACPPCTVSPVHWSNPMFLMVLWPGGIRPMSDDKECYTCVEIDRHQLGDAVLAEWETLVWSANNGQYHS